MQLFECVRRNVILVPCKVGSQDSYGGALVHDPVPDKNCSCVDVGHTVHYFRQHPVGILPGLLETLLTERAEIRKKMGNNIVMNKRQNALKIAANSIYGITGTNYSKYLRHKYCAESITGGGRHYFNKLVDFVKDRGLSLVYGDTDSCIISFPTEEGIRISKELCNEYNQSLPYPMHLKYESYSKKMLILSKKKYILLDEHNKLVYKGVTNARRGYCKFVKHLYEAIVEMIFDEIPSECILGYVFHRLNNIHKEPISEFVISKSVKSPHSYSTDVPQKLMAERLIREGENIVAGTRLEYVFVKNNEKKQGLKMYRPEELVKHGLSIDYDYYVSKQVCTTIDQLLELLGYPHFIKQGF
ncbi:hypothetical protein G6F27_011972 [Rhizopus arrhizus]|nr:hypothetical protein G6F27_011972 [Rhizopus arrhizus]